MMPKRTFILGGAASGKSAFAEDLIESSGLNQIYLATGRILDDEVSRRVEIHRARRDARWRTIEAPLDLGPALLSLGDKDAVLIDCATMWLSNHMLDGHDLAVAQNTLINDLNSTAASWVIVSNEVGHGIVPENALSRRFREAQGRLNIALAACADTAVLVVAGLPQLLKGVL